MESRPLLSLCIPTNGISEWVFPVLESIYKEANEGSVKLSLFEVIVTDNGNDQVFREEICRYQKDHANLRYQKTEAAGFLNEAESYKLAKGMFVKFINHRTCLKSGALNYWIRFIEKYQNATETPVVYFSNGVLSQKIPVQKYSSFDGFVRGLSYFSSWSTGLAFWKEDFDQMPADTEYNALFPHTTFLFLKTDRSEYIIDDTQLLEEMPVGHSKKGKYDLFFAFAVEYMGILLELCRAHEITEKTFLYIKKQNLYFLAECIISFKIRKLPCSYDLTHMWDSLHVFYASSDIYAAVGKRTAQLIGSKFRRRLRDFVKI